ncbi:formate dehydrogenase accessory sulfurtransferase FdhD [candidate division KSB3 bacterium]|uniref:Protein FdhD n=1 Tax=candidate division KSB3 bacterium TaxID=2044937 RepID=A0A9D5K0M2_9BACT|nr:formate dehydrogenase accessory sulfurtransferase FdhD [candidate division KSB3 bacterium]MBD3327441.1 formate dehydrogenase accessory sulfurtransferase FdhD [candidate division KSB3 bacterium]
MLIECQIAFCLHVFYYVCSCTRCQWFFRRKNFLGHCLTNLSGRQMRVSMKQPGDIPIVVHTPIWVESDRYSVIENPVCQEIPLDIWVNGAVYATLMRTPGLERELAVGLCFTDDLITSVEDIQEISCERADDSASIGKVCLTLPGVRAQDVNNPSPVKSSSGALTPRQRLDDLRRHSPAAASQPTFDLAVIPDLPEKLNARQVLRSQCGATHGAALFDRHGTCLFCAEDVGRHNGLDKLIGYVLLNHIDPRDTLLMLSSRASFEMIQKAAKLAIPVIASVSAPTDLALQAAERLQCTYISFLHRRGYFIYTHPWRFGLHADETGQVSHLVVDG